jgi:hypothetical protein
MGGLLKYSELILLVEHNVGQRNCNALEIVSKAVNFCGASDVG